MFSRRRLVSAEIRDWIDDCFDWFDARFPPPKAPILPTQSFFRAASGHDLAAAKAVLADVQRLLHYDLPIDLVELPSLPPELRHSYQAMGEVAGTFQETDEGRVIQYRAEQMHRPIQFINTLAHEVMHARLAGMEDLVPGGADMHELATDLGCIIAGFGIFQLRAADETGWSGYLTQDSRAIATALFLQHRQLPLSTVASHLSGRCMRLLTAAEKQL